MGPDPREIQWLGSAKHDNREWALVQVQVEFLEFSQQASQDPVDVIQLREEFDIFLAVSLRFAMRPFLKNFAQIILRFFRSKL
jgi:hypothetical protein